MTALFICFEKTSSGHGRITSSITVVDHVGYAHDLDAAGKSYMMVPLDGWTGYFTLDANGVPTEMNTRTGFKGSLDKSEVAILETATIPAVPACSVRFSGPLTDQTIQHPGGNLSMRFGLPGTYVITFEAFPFLPFETRLTVRQLALTKPEILK